MSIAQNILSIKKTLPPHVKLVVVSKTQPVENIVQAYDAGQRLFAESRPQVLLEKAAQLPTTIEWHFIGHLQTNKVKLVVGLAHTIHSVDSERLAREIEKEAERKQITQRCLLQIFIAQEEQKFGFSPEEIRALFADNFLSNFPHLQIIGLMGMATFTDDSEQIRDEFRTLKNLFDELKQKYFSDNPDFCELSMGMSGDYIIAIEEGSTMVRIGTSIFA